MAEQEREKTIARINQDLAVAKENGVRLGRPKAEPTKDFMKKYEQFLNGEYGKISHTGFAKMLGIGRSTLYKYISAYNQKESLND